MRKKYLEQGTLVKISKKWAKYRLTEGHNFHIRPCGEYDDSHYQTMLLAIYILNDIKVKVEVLQVNWPYSDLENYRLNVKLPHYGQYELNIGIKDIRKT